MHNIFLLALLAVGGCGVSFLLHIHAHGCTGACIHEGVLARVG